MDGLKLLSDLVFARTYSATNPDGSLETPTEAINRTRDMHIQRWPQHTKLISEAFQAVHDGLCVPSMRSLQCAGVGVQRSNARLYNCSFLAIKSFDDFHDLMWLLMNGCGVGYSVQQHHINRLPKIKRGKGGERFIIADTKEGWADSIVALLRNPLVQMDYAKIRGAGALLSTGGTASGPEPLMEAHSKIRQILARVRGRKLTSLEVHDICCYTASVVVVGGVRRSAMISLFSHDDSNMAACKSGSWWVDNPQRAMANNSAIILRGTAETDAQIEAALQACFASGSGEPGISLSNDLNLGYNPCHEISLRDKEFCNLTELIVNPNTTKESFLRAAIAAVRIGTLQAAYTEFPAIHPNFTKNAKRDALLGVSITGQAENWGLLADGGFLRDVAKKMKKENRRVAKLLGIRPAARIGCTKPSGSTSLWKKCTPGIHAAWDKFYVRRMRIDKTSKIAALLTARFPVWAAESGNFLEYDKFNTSNLVISVPVEKSGAIYRDDETAIQSLERSKHIFENWIKPSHTSGPNYHNVSLTVTYKPEETKEIVAWVLSNQESFAGVSFLPFDGGTYVQAPFESITHEEYLRRQAELEGIEDLDLFSSLEANNDKGQELACSGGGCEISTVK